MTGFENSENLEVETTTSNNQHSRHDKAGATSVCETKTNGCIPNPRSAPGRLLSVPSRVVQVGISLQNAAFGA